MLQIKSGQSPTQALWALQAIIYFITSPFPARGNASPGSEAKSLAQTLKEQNTLVAENTGRSAQPGRQNPGGLCPVAWSIDNLWLRRVRHGVSQAPSIQVCRLLAPADIEPHDRARVSRDPHSLPRAGLSTPRSQCSQCSALFQDIVSSHPLSWTRKELETWQGGAYRYCCRHKCKSTRARPKILH